LCNINSNNKNDSLWYASAHLHLTLKLTELADAINSMSLNLNSTVMTRSSSQMQTAGTNGSAVSSGNSSIASLANDGPAHEDGIFDAN
jgi:hypothetical protein